MCRKLFILVVVSFLLAPLLVGCGSERFETASIRRWENIGDVFRRVDSREREYRQRLNATGDIIEAFGDYHKKRLRISTELIRGLHQKQVDRWPQRLARTQEDIRYRMDGHPENIPAAIEGMWY